MLKPTNDRVVVQPMDAPTQTETGIYLAESARDPYLRGTVVATGPGKPLDSGDRAAMFVSVGDVVVVPPGRWQEFEVNGEKIVLVNEEDILGIIEEEE